VKAEGQNLVREADVYIYPPDDTTADRNEFLERIHWLDQANPIRQREWSDESHLGMITSSRISIEDTELQMMNADN
jgi:hypothetical protein